MSAEYFYHQAEHFPALAAQVGAHALQLLGPDIAVSDMAPAVYLVGDAVERPYTITVGLADATALRLEVSDFRRGALVRGWLPFAEMQYAITFEGEGLDGRPPRRHVVNNHPNWATGVWLDQSGNADSSLPKDLVEADLRTVLGVRPHQRVESLEPLSVLRGREARPVLDHFDDLLKRRGDGEYVWERYDDDGVLTTLATKNGKLVQGAASFTPSEGSQEDPFMVRWISARDGGQSWISGVRFLRHLGEGVTFADRSLKLEKDTDIPLDLFPSERLAAVERLRSITAQAEMPHL